MMTDDQQVDNLLEKLVERDAAKQMQESIDWEVLCSLLAWIHIELDRLTDNQHAIDITNWLAEYCDRSAYYRSGRKFLFKNETDAIMFKLRWGI